MGLVSRVVPDATSAPSPPRSLTALASTSGSALALTKRQFYQLDGLSFPEGIALGAQVNALSRTTPDFKKAIPAFLSKVNPLRLVTSLMGFLAARSLWHRARRSAARLGGHRLPRLFAWHPRVPGTSSGGCRKDKRADRPHPD